MVTGRDSWKLIGLLWICYLSVQAVLVPALWSFRGKLAIEHLALLNSAVLVLVLLLPTLLFVLRKGQSWREAFRWRRISLRVIVATVLGTFALGVALSQVTLWLIRSLENSVFLEHSKFTNLLVATSRTNSPVLLLLAVMFPALPEELTFRGFIQQGFERRYSPPIAIALTSFIFALFHLDLIQSLSVMAIAAFWGWVVWRSQSVLPSLIAHALQNGLTIVSVLATSARSEGLQESVKVFTVSPNWVAAAIGLLFWLGMVLTLMRCLPRRGEGNGTTANGVLSHQVGTANGGYGIRSPGTDERC
jgi:membrane protease YdiL (CAAX protease family)